MAPLAPHSGTGPSRRARDPGGPETRADQPFSSAVWQLGSQERRHKGAEARKLGRGLGVHESCLAVAGRPPVVTLLVQFQFTESQLQGQLTCAVQRPGLYCGL